MVISQLDASRLQAAMPAAEPRSDAFTMNHRMSGHGPSGQVGTFDHVKGRARCVVPSEKREAAQQALGHQDSGHVFVTMKVAVCFSFVSCCCSYTRIANRQQLHDHDGDHAQPGSQDDPVEAAGVEAEQTPVPTLRASINPVSHEPGEHDKVAHSHVRPIALKHSMPPLRVVREV
eukprot:scaffold80530_cov77-Phaeocystis_antarctica.AAC.1